MNTSTRKPTTPGEMLRTGFLAELSISQENFARHIGVTFTTISKIINGHARVTAEMAVKFGAALGTSPEFWLNAQMATDLWEIRQSGEKLPPPLVAEAS